jgi:hypothetical protein
MGYALVYLQIAHCFLASASNKSSVKANGYQHWWTDTDGEKPKYWEKTLSEFSCLHHRFHMD